MEFQLVSVSHDITETEKELIYDLFLKSKPTIEDLQRGLQIARPRVEDWILVAAVKALINPAERQNEMWRFIDEVEPSDIRIVIQELARDMIADRLLRKIVRQIDEIHSQRETT